MDNTLKKLIEGCLKVFGEMESHANWDKYLHKVKYLTLMFKKEPTIFQSNNFVSSMMEIIDPIKESIITDRTTLSIATNELVSIMVINLKERFQIFIPIYIPALIKVLGRSNKVLRETSYQTLGDIVNTFPFSNMIQNFLYSLNDTNNQVREYCILLVDLFIFKWKSNVLIDSQKYLERCIILGLKDKDLNVRYISRHTYQCYLFKLSERENILNEQLNEDILKGIRNTPYPSLKCELLRPIQQFERNPNLKSIQNSRVATPQPSQVFTPQYDKLLQQRSSLIEKNKNKHRKVVPSFPIPNYSWVKPKVDTRRANNKLQDDGKVSETPKRDMETPIDRETSLEKGKRATSFDGKRIQDTNTLNKLPSQQTMNSYAESEENVELETNQHKDDKGIFKKLNEIKDSINILSKELKVEIKPKKRVLPPTIKQSDNNILRNAFKPNATKYTFDKLNRKPYSELPEVFSNRELLPTENCPSCRKYIYNSTPSLPKGIELEMCKGHVHLAKNIPKFIEGREFKKLKKIILDIEE